MKRHIKTWGVGLLCLLLATTLILPAAAAPIQNTGVIYESYVNPEYAHLQLPQPQEPAPTRAAVKAVYRETLEEAALDLRAGMVQRQETITVAFKANGATQQMMRELYTIATVHTGIPKEGDYIVKHLIDWNAGMSYAIQSGTYLNEATFNFRYLSNTSQEQAVDAAVKTLLNQLNVYQGTDLERVTAIYDYMCKNITYDYSLSDLSHTAYASLINKQSVCQGYASLFYRLSLELGVDVRVITGIGNNGRHAWNIVKLNGKYYNLDATWDAGNTGSYFYFLRCNENFVDHTRDAEFLTAEFLRTYPMSDKDHSLKEEIILGDLDGRSGVNEADVLRLIKYILMPGIFNINQNADFTGDDKVDEGDALRLLKYVLMPDFYPLS